MLESAHGSGDDKARERFGLEGDGDVSGESRVTLARASNAMLVQLSRFVFATLGALAGLNIKDLIDWKQEIGYSIPTVIVLFVILGAAVGFIFGGIIGRETERVWLFLEDYLRHMELTDLLLGGIGLLAGLVFALILSVPVRMLQPPVVALLGQVAMFVVLGYTCTRIALIRRRDVAGLLERWAPAPMRKRSGLKLLDTSAVIDGRFAELIRAGFLDGDVRVPGFVLSELQTLADSAEDARRTRGRRGLDLLATTRSEHPIEVMAADYPDTPEVDAKLVRLARDADASIVTVDFNLAQVARAQGVGVLNMNDLAAALRPSHLPGEIISLHVMREGKESDQGVGYLEDGTMVVVQNGRPLLGEMADVVVTSVLQTSGGRMIFARPQAAE